MPRRGLLRVLLVALLLLCVEGRSISSGNSHSCALLSEGKVMCWGTLTNFGTLLQQSTSPAEVSGITTATSVASGGVHHCALLDDGEVTCWGFNHYGQLGNGTTTDSTIPVTVSGITTATSIALGGGHSCAVLTSGTVMCWGHNSMAQLGDGISYQDRSTPFEVSGITNAVSIALGGDNSCALLTESKVMCWGYNAEGQLGRGGINTQDEPPGQVSNITTATSIAVGVLHSCAVLIGGTVKCWGYNSGFRLGQSGTATYSNTPVAVSGITSATNITLGEGHSYALLTDGGVMCWGDNLFGGLGGGTVPHAQFTPVSASDITDATGISLGSEYSCATLSNGSVKCWGANWMGQLGIGDLSDCQCTNAFEVSGLNLTPSSSSSSSFSDRTELNTAVTNCLAIDYSGVACCASADCGPAGSTEMPGWDVGSVTDMNGLFNAASAFNADISAWDTSSVTTMIAMFENARTSRVGM